MAEKQVSAAPTVTTEKKVKKVAAAKAPKAKRNHPPTSVMVDAAISALKERGGSSVLAIKKYAAATYKIDVEKMAPFIKRYIKGAVVKGHLLQTKGKGASGSFKLATKAPTKKVASKPKKVTASAKPKVAVKQAVTKKAAPKKKPAAAEPKKASTVKAKPAKVTVPKKPTAPKAKKPAAKKVSAKK